MAPGVVIRVDWFAEIFDSGDVLTEPVRRLLLGQRIRCDMAASLIHRPEILFFDELSIGLEVVVKQRIPD